MEYMQRLTPGLAVGSAAQFAAAHCPNERTLNPPSAFTELGEKNSASANIIGVKY